jgi:5-hydroxyisourate hydrolase
MSKGISLHAVDVAAGVPAAGLRVQVFRLEDGKACCVVDARLGSAGQLQHPVTEGEGVIAGTHETLFYLGDWWRERTGHAERCFQEVAVFRFEVLDVNEHYHLPIKFTPWGFALFRGA